MTRHLNDYYITPQEEIALFLDAFAKQENIDLENYSYLDPCCGGDEENGASYPEVLAGLNLTRVFTMDIREDSRADVIGDYLSSPKIKADIIITNPPFSHAVEFIKKALYEIGDNGYVIMLLRLTILGSHKRFDFWKQNMPHQIYLHHKRMSFTADGKTDSTEYAHFVWKKNSKKNTQLFVI